MKRILIAVLILLAMDACGQVKRSSRRVMGHCLARVQSSGAFVDSFSTGSTLGPRWTSAGTWTVSGGSVSCTPTLGAELITNGGFETWTTNTNAGTWTEYTFGDGVVRKDSTNVHGGSYSVALKYNAGVSEIYVLNNGNVTSGDTYQLAAWCRGDGTASFRLGGDAAADRMTFAKTTSYQQFFVVFRSGSASIPAFFGSSDTLYVDDVSLKRITRISAIATVNAGIANVDVSVGITGGKATTTYSDVGLIVSYADTANYVRASFDYTATTLSASLEKCVAGTWTTVITGAITYSAGAAIRVTKSGNNYSLYYNGTQVGSTTAINDAAIVSNTNHGCFSTYSGNTLDNFRVARFP